MAVRSTRLIVAAAVLGAALVAWVAVDLFVAFTTSEGEGNSRRSVNLVVYVDDRDTTHELVLAPADLAALGLAPGPIREQIDYFRLETAFTDSEDVGFRYCLTEAARVVVAPSGAVAAEIPAGTCLESGQTLDVDVERAT